MKTLKKAAFLLLGGLPLFVFGCVTPGQFGTMDSKQDSLRLVVDDLQKKVAAMEKAYQAQLEENQKLGAELKSNMRELGRKLDATQSQVQDVGGRFDYLFRNWEEFKARLQNLRPPPDSMMKKDSARSQGNNIGVDPKQLYDNAFLDFRRAKYDLAIAGFEEFLATFPNSELTPNCHFWVAESFSAKGMADSAVNRYVMLAQTFPRSEKVPTALYKAAQALEKTNLDMAERYYDQVADQYPNSTEARRAKDRLNVIRKR
jgi:tol-pal system protein YbgF